MIAPMTKYSFILLKGEEKGLLERLQELGLVDITRTVKPVDETSAALAAKVERMDGIIAGIRQAEIPEGTSAGTCPERDLVQLADETLTHFSESAKTVGQLSKEVEVLQNWGHFEPEVLQKLADAGVTLHFHVLNPKLFQTEWADEYALTEVNRTKDAVYFVVAGNDALPGEVAPPKADLGMVQKQLREAVQEREQHFGEIAALKTKLPELEQLRAQTYAKLDLYLATQAAVPAAENAIVTLVGYATTENDEAVTAALEAADVFFMKDAASVEDNPPIAFKNNKFVRMFEVLTDMYGRPAYDGFDPTPFIAIFFLLFFAFCMGDAGYGLLLVVIGLLLKKVDSFKGLAPLVVTLGIGTTVIGFLFHTFFSMDIAKWPIFKGFPFLPAQIAGYDGTMVLALVVGIVHLCLAMIVKTVNETRTKGFVNCLGTWGWTLLIVGGVIVAGFALAGVLDQTATKWVVIILGVLSAAGIFLLNDLHRNPLLNIGAGLWETYNTVTGLLGDVLSYLRLYALGLAGAMLGKAFNDIGLMMLGDGSQVAMWIPFVLIVLVGHTLNIAMCALGAFVHPLRLNFLEFFKNSGYEASGRKYNPLKK